MIEIGEARQENLAAICKDFSQDACQQLANLGVAIDRDDLTAEETADQIETALFELIDRTLLCRLQFELAGERPGTSEQIEGRIHAVRDQIQKLW